MHCLEKLAAVAADRRQPDARRSRAASRVENAVLLGAPVSARVERWRAARTAVSGRLVNGYSDHDWMLKYLYAYKARALVHGVAGTQPVAPQTAARKRGAAAAASALRDLDVGGPLADAAINAVVRERMDIPDVENVDLTDLVNGHLAYPLVMQQILARLRLED